MKYINFENVGIVIFDNSVSHRDMAQLIGQKVNSAGTFRCNDPRCYGESTSLKVESSEEDQFVIEMMGRR
jgi:hypothetical protein